ncbi:hypothetical protein LTR66_000179 [Elasticomyces elasticus]|nr:hypothetical protein LTR66_000179 [Elasticomyces elasticus]
MSNSNPIHLTSPFMEQQSNTDMPGLYYTQEQSFSHGGPISERLAAMNARIKQLEILLLDAVNARTKQLQKEERNEYNKLKKASKLAPRVSKAKNPSKLAPKVSKAKNPSNLAPKVSKAKKPSVWVNVPLNQRPANRRGRKPGQRYETYKPIDQRYLETEGAQKIQAIVIPPVEHGPNDTVGSQTHSLPMATHTPQASTTSPANNTLSMDQTAVHMMAPQVYPVFEQPDYDVAFMHAQSVAPITVAPQFPVDQSQVYSAFEQPNYDVASMHGMFSNVVLGEGFVVKPCAYENTAQPVAPVAVTPQFSTDQSEAFLPSGQYPWSSDAEVDYSVPMNGVPTVPMNDFPTTVAAQFSADQSRAFLTSEQYPWYSNEKVDYNIPMNDLSTTVAPHFSADQSQAFLPSGQYPRDSDENIDWSFLTKPLPSRLERYPYFSDEDVDYSVPMNDLPAVPMNNFPTDPTTIDSSLFSFK